MGPRNLAQYIYIYINTKRFRYVYFHICMYGVCVNVGPLLWDPQIQAYNILGYSRRGRCSDLQRTLRVAVASVET